jgi:VRR-NUC domain
MKEQAIQSEILRYLRARGVMAWKAGTGAVRAEYKGRSRFVRFGVPGQPDILGVLPGGRALAIEVKTAKGVLTPAQRVFLAAISEHGALTLVARSVAEVHAVLGPLDNAPVRASECAPEVASVVRSPKGGLTCP